MQAVFPHFPKKNSSPAFLSDFTYFLFSPAPFTGMIEYMTVNGGGYARRLFPKPAAHRSGSYTQNRKGAFSCISIFYTSADSPSACTV